MKLRDFLKLIGLAALCPAEVPAESGKVMFDAAKLKGGGDVFVSETKIEIHWFLTTNILIRTLDERGDAQYDCNVYGEFGAIIAKVFVMQPDLRECKWLKVESAPFNLSDNKTTLLDRLKVLLAEINRQVEAHPEKLVPLSSFPATIRLGEA